MKVWDYLQDKEISPRPADCIKAVRFKQDYIWLQDGTVIRSMRDGRYLLEGRDEIWYSQGYIENGEEVEFTGHYIKL